MIHITSLSFAFASAWALKNLNVHIPAGSFVFLTGPSGAGKTTLLRILHGSLPVQRGKATIAGYDLHGLGRRDLPRLRQEVTVVFQDFKVLPKRSVRDNVGLPLKLRGLPRDQIDRRVNAVLRAVQLEPRENILCGYLSGGEQQRVAITRSIVVKPKVLLADEPTGNVDPSTSLRLLEIFSTFHAHGTTILLATHDHHLLQVISRSTILRLDQGRLCSKDHRPNPSPPSQR